LMLSKVGYLRPVLRRVVLAARKPNDFMPKESILGFDREHELVHRATCITVVGEKRS